MLLSCSVVKLNHSTVLQQSPGAQIHICNELQLPPGHRLGFRSHLGLQYLSDVLKLKTASASTA